jgi:hypothetical protein
VPARGSLTAESPAPHEVVHIVGHRRARDGEHPRDLVDRPSFGEQQRDIANSSALPLPTTENDGGCDALPAALKAR